MKVNFIVLECSPLIGDPGLWIIYFLAFCIIGKSMNMLVKSITIAAHRKLLSEGIFLK